MLSMEQYKNDLATAREEIRTIEQRVAELNQILATWAEKERLLAGLCDLENDVVQGQLLLPSLIEVSGTKKRKAKARKRSDVQVIEDILRAHGPLHVTEIVRLGQEQGVMFKGSKAPRLMARDKMYGSKRYVNFGGNVWGLPGQTLPPAPGVINGEYTSITPTHAEEPLLTT